MGEAQTVISNLALSPLAGTSPYIFVDSLVKGLWHFPVTLFFLVLYTSSSSDSQVCFLIQNYYLDGALFLGRTALEFTSTTVMDFIDYHRLAACLPGSFLECNGRVPSEQWGDHLSPWLSLPDPQPIQSHLLSFYSHWKLAFLFPFLIVLIFFLVKPSSFTPLHGF